MKRFFLIIALIYTFINSGFCQSSYFGDRFFKSISLRTDTLSYNTDSHYIKYQDAYHLFFKGISSSQVVEVRLFPVHNANIKNLNLLPSRDFEIIDSVAYVNDSHYRAKIEYHNLFETQLPVLIFEVNKSEEKAVNYELKLFPYFKPEVRKLSEPIELFAGEEKTINLGGRHLFNVATPNEWQETDGFEYSLSRSSDFLSIDIRPKRTGSKTLEIPLKTKRPVLSDTLTLSHTLPPLHLPFHIKPSRLQFINTDKETIFHDPVSMRSEEIQIDYHPDIRMNRTYRIENQQERGGQLIAEITPKSVVGNRIICDIRTYFLHRVSNGYLYIKDGSRTLYMTNFNIVYRPEITNIEILREGRDWTSNLSVFPGENIEVKIEGSGLYHTHIDFDGCISRRDSIRLSDQVVFYNLKIPADLPRRKIVLFMNNSITQHELLVREHQKPAPFNFISINYGTENISITQPHFNQPVLYSETVKDINIIFHPDSIDIGDDFKGKQYINIEVRLLDNNNRLLDIQTINNVVVCPGSNSLRYAFYDASDCNAPILNLNDYLIRKTYHLDAFSQIIITFKHNENRYSSVGHNRKITIILERKSKFDIQVSFPAGLLVKEFKEAGIGNLSGISTSVLAEFSFYDSKQLGRLRPYRIGAGFIALNAFNFNESANITRDIGLVVMGAIEPVNKNAKFSVPIYLGAGYLLKNNDAFAIFGPGIRFQF